MSCQFQLSSNPTLRLKAKGVERDRKILMCIFTLLYDLFTGFFATFSRHSQTIIRPAGRASVGQSLGTNALTRVDQWGSPLACLPELRESVMRGLARLGRVGTTGFAPDTRPEQNRLSRRAAKLSRLGAIGDSLDKQKERQKKVGERA